MTRRKDVTKSLLPKHIFDHAELTIKQVKKRGFHFRINIIETEERLNEWYYRERKILETQKKQKTILKNNHNDLIIEHSEFKETLRKIKQKYY